MPEDRLKTDHIETATDTSAFSNWPEGLYEEMIKGQNSGCVGSVLVSETADVRVWHLHLPPGERCPFHCHVNPYFWSALTAGKARSYFSSGEIKDGEYYVGETQHFFYGEGEYMVHSLENIGETMLSFATVEFLNGPNEPLEVPAEFRLEKPAA